MNDFTFTGEGFSDYLYWQTQDKKTLKFFDAPQKNFFQNLDFKISLL